MYAQDKLEDKDLGPTSERLASRPANFNSSGPQLHIKMERKTKTLQYIPTTWPIFS